MKACVLTLFILMQLANLFAALELEHFDQEGAAFYREIALSATYFTDGRLSAYPIKWGLNLTRRLMNTETKSVFPRLFENLGYGRVREADGIEFFG